jgi:FkbM family methyltransferase
MKQMNFIFCKIPFEIQYNPSDSTGIACIHKIVRDNEYLLDRFINQKNKVFIDIGSNIGIATIIMAKLNPESIVYSYEPYKKAYDMLVTNIKLNSLTNVKAFNIAVSNKINKSLVINIHEKMSGANSTYANDNLFQKKWKCNCTDTTECISFDEIIRINNITNIELLKIDAEGAEFDIIYDSDLFKDKIVNNMVGEFHDLFYNKIHQKSIDLLSYCDLYIDGILKIYTLVIK